MADCEHLVLSKTAEGLRCQQCLEENVTLTISGTDLLKLMTTLEEIARMLDLAGITDTAVNIRAQAQRLLVRHQVSMDES